jgi:hypothetical protein
VHWFGDPVITPTPEGAHAEHYGMLIDRTPDGFRMRAPSVRTYELRRENGRWKIFDRGIRHMPAEG